MATGPESRNDNGALHWTERPQRFDRRGIFLAIGLPIVRPLLLPNALPIQVGRMPRATYNTGQGVKAGDVGLVSLDLDAAPTPELEPFYKAVILQLKRKGARLVFATTWYQAPPLVERWIRDTVERPLAPAGTEGYSGAPDR